LILCHRSWSLNISLSYRFRILTWYLTYTRTLGRGFTLDDPDTIAYLTTNIASIMYFIYYIQVNVQPEQYASNMLYAYADVLYLVSAIYYVLTSLRDDHWFWFLPLAGQYDVAPGRIQIESNKRIPSYGKPTILLTDLCRKRKSSIIARARYSSHEINIPTASDRLNEIAFNNSLASH
jgi:hypothetical protein